MKKLIIIAVAIITIIISWLAWLILKPSPLEQDFVSGNGRIEATEIDIATKLGGRIINIFADEGDFVKQGQVLVQMQINILEAERDEAKAQHQQAINAANSIAAQVSVRESDLAAAQALVVQRENELDAAQRRFARSQALLKKGAVSVQVFDDDRAAVRSCAAALNAAKAKVVAAQHVIDATKAQLIGAKSTIEATAATVTRVEAEIADSQLKAPRDARVQYRIAEPGEMLSSGGKVLNLIDINDVYMTFFLPETVVGRIALGSEARVVLDTAPDYVIPAKITFIASTAQFTPKTVETASERQKLMFRVKASIDHEVLKKHVEQIKIGLPGVAWIKLNPHATWPKNLMYPTKK